MNTGIVPCCSDFFCVKVISLALVVMKQRNTIRFATIWLKWKTALISKSMKCSLVFLCEFRVLNISRSVLRDKLLNIDNVQLKFYEVSMYHLHTLLTMHGYMTTRQPCNQSMVAEYYCEFYIFYCINSICTNLFL